MDYKRLGDYIREVNVRNKDLKVTNLEGVSISKQFIPSIANTIGTDMSTYKVVNPGQFAYGPVTSRNGDKVSIALYKGDRDAIISQAYTVFEVVDSEKMSSEYLMMWFQRPEFDRYARFHSHGSAREIFDWDELCDVYLPLPDIARQREIVEEYETLSRRIRLNEQMIEKLEATAQALYRKMFVDGIDKENLPEGWRMGTLGNLAEIKNGKAIVPSGGDIPVYGGNGIIGYTSRSNAEDVVVIGRVGINCGSLYLHQSKCYVNDNAMIAIPKNGNTIFLYRTMKEMDLNCQSEGSGQPLLTQSIIYKQECLIPKLEQRIKFEEQMEIVYKQKSLKEKENSKLTELQSLLLAKMGQ
ncbi:restriction endonuclease subunit S [Prevotella communis]|uniref:restriction endonuclease subunit S n=1 Tax=Prevotella communis TaxID=2913614 RepID=UPI001ED9E8CA|nr:restriction endonuclease subunit S [Prevotella communis]UKK66938.1 restriction endonuclease subunit S [Prevotella communis]UKK70923.1 restriction endonuclease subunit S [Prevotella communis]